MTSRRLLLLFGAGSQTRAVNDVLIALGAILLYDGTLALTKIDNLGTGGAALDGTPTDVTVDADGMHFNGTTSLIAVPNNAALTGLAVSTYAYLLRPATAGESGIGHFHQWGNTNGYVGFGGALTSLNARVSAGGGGSGTRAETTTTTGLAADTLAWVFRTYDNTGDRKIHLYKGVNGVVSEFAYSLQQAASAALDAVSTLTIGNSSGGANTYDGAIVRAAIFSGVLTAGNMAAIAAAPIDA